MRRQHTFLISNTRPHRHLPLLSPQRSGEIFKITTSRSKRPKRITATPTGLSPLSDPLSIKPPTVGSSGEIFLRRRRPPANGRKTIWQDPHRLPLPGFPPARRLSLYLSLHPPTVGYGSWQESRDLPPSMSDGNHDLSSTPCWPSPSPASGRFGHIT